MFESDFKTNIFMNSYEQPENKLTYSFLTLIEHLHPDASLKILSTIIPSHDMDKKHVEKITIELLYGGGETNPDGSILVRFDDSSLLNIYFENKTWRRGLDINQINGHAKQYLNSPDNILLVITSDKSDKEILDQLGDQRIFFRAWPDFIDDMEQTRTTISDGKDPFLINQFIEYAERSGEAWRARMIKESLIKSYSIMLGLSKDIKDFYNESWRLMEKMKEDILPSFTGYIKTGKVAQHFGRLGVECVLTTSHLDEWIFFGIYYDTVDHGIPFVVHNEPEYAIFFDMNPKNRPKLMEVDSIMDAADRLKDIKYERNFPENTCKNAWRICYWREPLKKYTTADISELKNLFEAQLRLFFESDFYKKVLSVKST